MTPEELEQFRKNAKLEGENEALKKSMPFNGQTFEKSVGEHEVGFALRMGMKAAAEHTTVDEIAKKWKEEAGGRYKNAANAEAIAKGMNGTGLTSGGWLLTPNYSNEFIPALREKTVVRAAGAQIVDMVNGNIIYRTEGSGTIAYWVDEAAKITDSSMTGGLVRMESKKCAAAVIVSNDLLRYASPELDAQIENDLTYALGYKEDLAFIRGTAVTGQPQSFKTLIDSTHQFAQTASPTYLTIEQDMSKARLKLRQANIPNTKGTWIVSPRTEFYLMTLRDANGFYMFRDEMLSKHTIYGMPYFSTQVIPDNLGASSNASEIYLLDMNQVLIGKDLEMNVEFFPNGTFVDGSGNVRGIQTDESVFRAIMRTQLGLKYAKAGAIITGVTWGAA